MKLTRISDEQTMKAHEGEKCRDCGESIANTQLASCQKEHDEEIEELAGYICEECSTPGFVHLVIPKRIWEQKYQGEGR